MQLTYHPDAETELIEAARFYERSLPTLGDQFLDAIEEAVREIQKSPRIWRVAQAEVRIFLVRRFPFGIYFRLLPDQIRILSIKHHSRHSSIWRDRIDE